MSLNEPFMQIRELNHKESALLDSFLEKKEGEFKDAINWQLKIYSEQVILLCLYAREAIRKNETLLQRLCLMNHINEIDNETITPELKSSLMMDLNGGFDFFSIMSRHPDVVPHIQNFSTEKQIMFKRTDTSNFPYHCSQLSPALFKVSDMLKLMMAWLDKYSKPDTLRKEMVRIICNKSANRESIGERKWSLEQESQLDHVASTVLTECYNEISSLYLMINEYTPSTNYDIHIREESDKPQSKDKILSEKHDRNYKINSQTVITFDSRLRLEGDRKTLIEKIENTLFAPTVASHTTSTLTKLVLLTDIKNLSLWHKKSESIIKRLDQIPRYVASIIESDLKFFNSAYDSDKESWYSFVTSIITAEFNEDGLMCSWCRNDADNMEKAKKVLEEAAKENPEETTKRTLEETANEIFEKAAKERFKKKVNYLKFRLKSYEPISRVIGAAINNSESYPLQSTTYPPLWIPFSFKSSDVVYSD